MTPIILISLVLAVMAWILWGIRRRPRVRLEFKIDPPEPKDVAHKE